MPPGRGPGPVDTVRARFAAEAGAAAAALLPRGYARLGSVLRVALPEALRPHYPRLGVLYGEVFGVRAVLRPAGPARGEFREPSMEAVLDGPTETEVVEHGVRYRFDAARILFARGNTVERDRARRLVRPGETVYDLFAGIGYFILPAALAHPSVRGFAVEANPLSYRYLAENLARHGVADRIAARLGDNRSVELPVAGADRIFLGYLPSAAPWLDRALALARPGATIHLHEAVDAREGPAGAARRTAEALYRRGVPVVEVRGRAVKPYGPGRTHVVLDIALGPAPPA